MDFRHTPVLFTETIESLNIKSEGIYVDGTLGGGGHAAGICKNLSQKGILICIDRDRDALNAAEKNLEKFNCKKYFIHSNYENIKEILRGLNISGIDGAVLDLGVSSFQLDNPKRGFSYMKEGPLDMRMNKDDELTAHTIVNEFDKDELTEIIKKYGEERWAARISEFIVKERNKEPIVSTYQLVDIIKAAIPASARREGPHPAKRTFQALRIYINDELGQLSRSIDHYIDVLNSRGRLSIITFHSLEDRIVKEAFNSRLDPCTCPKELPVCICNKKTDVKKVCSKPIKPSDQELKENPRARSAKLRFIEKR
ncbi:MAG: 16S rRNA (cytosine(1402)-N(4))-methyltransferase RsmH [Clostridiales bacterium]|jgi:16S rRNA (cytosine1402-N4)-methyltransferase|nr:16S rRNA (cytosine(1402)-N(4))-methyltransferase RsmH [Clostridiales bacterium]